MRNLFMRYGGYLAVAAILVGVGTARAQDAPGLIVPRLSLAPDDDNVYAPPALPSEKGGLNQGGVNFGLTVTYATDYVYRGIDRSEEGGKEDSPNTQFDTRVDFNLDKLPHPFIGVFVNVFNSDPVSQFQEVRPFFGVDWTLRPLRLEVGHQTFLFPDRDEDNTAEVYGKLTIDDSLFWGTEKPLFSPYVLAAYDYDQNKGWYIEIGIAHEFVFEDVGLTITPTARVGYVTTYQLYADTLGGDDTGFQHYDVGFTTKYSLTKLLDIPQRYGDWSLTGLLFYTDGMEGDLRADTQLWGGVGIGFRY